MTEQRTPVAARRQRLHWFAGRLHQVLDEVSAGAGPAACLSASEVEETVAELTSASARIESLLLATLSRAEVLDVAGETGATSTAAWLAQLTRRTNPRAHALVRLADRLDAAYAETREALAAGRIDVEQARVVVRAMDALPASVGAEDRARAEKHLLVEAEQFDAGRLRLLGERLLEAIDPDAADEALGRKLEAEERRAASQTSLTMRDDGEGVCHGRFRLPSRHGAMLLKALQALASPGQPDAIERKVTAADPQTGEPVVRQRLSEHVLGEALCRYVERFPADRLQHGGVEATVVVTMPLETLMEGVGAAGLDTGGQISAAEARRLACQAGVIPAVLGGRSEVLDLGRRRFFSRHQRIAMALRDGGCTTVGCDRPAAWCQADHVVPAAQGGRTDLGNGRLLCARHHTLVHSPRYRHETTPEGKVRFTRIRQ